MKDHLVLPYLSAFMYAHIRRYVYTHIPHTTRERERGREREKEKREGSVCMCVCAHEFYGLPTLIPSRSQPKQSTTGSL